MNNITTPNPRPSNLILRFFLHFHFLPTVRNRLVVCLVTSIICVSQALAVAQDSATTQDPSANQLDSNNPETVPGVTIERLLAASGILENPPTVHSTEETARVLWAIQRLPESFWETQDLGNALTRPMSEVDEEISLRHIKGVVKKVVAIRVPDQLAEIIEIEKLYRLTVSVQATSRDSTEESTSQHQDMTIVASQIPEVWAKAGDSLNERIEATGVLLKVEQQDLLFAKRVRWLMEPESEQNAVWPVGWKLLGAEGFDCGLLEPVARRSRGPLVAEDNEAFYGMLAIAKKLENSESSLPEPTLIDMADLLRKNRQLVGHWLRLNLETARLTRVVVTDAGLRKKLESDAFWQIDGFGDLDRVRIELEAGQGGNENLVFENRFPLSLAIVDLPDWLRQQVEAQSGSGRVDVSMLTEPVQVDAFFYRLWSYDSEFATSRGGRQVAPLLIVTRLDSRAAELAATSGQVENIGWFLAIAVIGSILLTTLVLWRMAKRDAAIRARRSSSTP